MAIRDDPRPSRKQDSLPLHKHTRLAAVQALNAIVKVFWLSTKCKAVEHALVADGQMQQKTRHKDGFTVQRISPAIFQRATAFFPLTVQHCNTLLYKTNDC